MVIPNTLLMEINTVLELEANLLNKFIILEMRSFNLYHGHVFN
jgi:hypothetical protein